MRPTTRWAILFMGPPILLFTAIVVVPTAMALRLSFTDANILGQTSQWVGIDNFVEAFTNEHVRKSIRITLVWTLFGALIPPALGLGIAMMLQANTRFAAIMKSALFVPISISLVVVGQVWIWIYQPGDGLINQMLGLVGLESLEEAWLANRSTALWAVFIAWAWQQSVLAMILYLAGLTSIPGELVEAARVDGAAQFQVFRRVIVPLLRPITTVVLSLIAINSLRNFDLVFAMTQGGPVRETETMPMLVWRILFRQHEQGLASAVSLILFAMTLVVVGGLTWWGRRGSYVD
ncbi:MAG: sugar ABC transporter permease [Acidimicrobiaceae bacterium]|nr:sugar ABC transporter permease [Acidimicrobiaceae bacterium]